MITIIICSVNGAIGHLQYATIACLQAQWTRFVPALAQENALLTSDKIVMCQFIGAKVVVLASPNQKR
ncbi:hypothetical protein HF313_25020 [Massilia atriviolacea]|uniref:Uncharacterized protein n=1 Tax=Massilia atriviolacea TaxID=2495579 RepID=A0A430HNG8_9BURK|nr:hypothetical protein [Massilia atriviolacea]RSZ59053.1 hypothetical protein EJB06_12060 [Massilia atriviolacea]